jgi:4'-phosphopantetheinyl transferase
MDATSSTGEPVWENAPDVVQAIHREVHVWRAVLGVASARIQPLVEVLSAEERERAERFCFQRDRNRFMAERAGDIRYTRAEISESQRCLGYRPQVSFEEGLARTVEYFGKQIAWSFSAPR